MKGRNLIWLQLVVLGLTVGILGITQLRPQDNIAEALQSEPPVSQAQTMSNLLESNAALAQEAHNLEGQLSKYSQGVKGSNLEALVSDINRFKAVNGLVEVWGPGVEVVVGASIKQEEAHDIINELRNAGAEALSLNGQRLVTTSAVTQSQDRAGLLVDGTALTPPYVFGAIGDVQTMEAAVERKGGVVPLLRYTYRESKISVLRVKRLLLPIYQGKYIYRFARPAEQQSTDPGLRVNPHS